MSLNTLAKSGNINNKNPIYSREEKKENHYIRHTEAANNEKGANDLHH